MPENFKRNIALDGLRGIAITLVIIHHAVSDTQVTSPFSHLMNELAISSWIGVDLFFVLSGFLITGILLNSREDPHYFRTFYMRRIFRIFPLYYAFLTALFLASFIRPQIQIDRFWNLAYLANVRVALHGWPWRPLSHLWSLSIEEQFYLVWPAFIFLIPRRHTILAIGALLGALVATRQWLGHAGAGAVAIYTLLHLDGLLIGAILATIHRSALRHTARALNAARIILLLSGCILTVVFMQDADLPWPYWTGAGYLNYTLIAAAGAALIATSLNSPPASTLNRILSFPPLVHLGTYSYAIYVFHYAIDQLARHFHLLSGTRSATIRDRIVLNPWELAASVYYYSPPPRDRPGPAHLNSHKSNPLNPRVLGTPIVRFTTRKSIRDFAISLQ